MRERKEREKEKERQRERWKEGEKRMSRKTRDDGEHSQSIKAAWKV